LESNPQINHAKDLIDDNHPLDRTPLLKALPYLKIFQCCLGRPKKDFRRSMRKAILQKMGMKVPKSDLKLQEDPFLLLGILIHR